MARVTRSGKNAQPSSSKRTLEDVLEDNSTSDSSDHQSVSGSQNSQKKPQPRSTEGTTLKSLLTRALGGAEELERENDALRKKVKALEDRLDRVVEPDDAPLQPSRRSKRTAHKTAAELRGEVGRLTKQVKRLEKSTEKYRKRMHELSMKELKSEAEDLVDIADLEVGDSAYKMRQLLREFSDLMLMNSLEGNEQCPICLGSLQPKETRSFPCQHTYCNDCVKQILPQPGEFEALRCPQCRGVYPREEIKLVEYTATEQWDMLLEVARKWAKIDPRREEDTTEEEDAEDFIDDGEEEEEESSTTASEPAPARSLESTPEPTYGSPQTPSRLRKRHVVASPPAGGEKAEPEEPSIPSEAEHEARTAASKEQVKDEQADTPPHTTTNSRQRAPSYSQSPAKDKRKMLEQLAEARNKKRKF